MLEGVAGEGGVVHLDVHLEVLFEAVGLEEADHGFGVDVILVLGGFHGLGLDEEGAGEALGACIVAGHGEHHCQVFLFALLVGVEQAHIAFAAAPEYVVLTAEGDGGVDGVLDLHGSAGNDVEVGVGGGAVHVAAVAEDVGCAPEVLDAGFGHLLLEIGGDFFHAALVVGDVLAGVADEISVVEAEVLDAEFFHHLEACIGFLLGNGHGVGTFVPGEFLGAGAELVAALGAEGVPPGHSELEPFLHGFAEDHAVCVIVAVCHGVVRGGAFVFDFSHRGEVFFLCHCCFRFMIVCLLLLIIYLSIGQFLIPNF